MRFIALVLALVLAAGGALTWRLAAPKPRYSAAEWEAIGAAGNADAGRIMFFAAGCGACHQTPGQDDPLLLGGGRKLATSFGAFYPPNISSDPIDGIGAWRPVDIANALLSGVSPKGEHYYPALPYTSYQRMAPADVADLIAFLRTVPRASGRAPAHVLPFPLCIRPAVGLWKLLFFDNAGLAPDPGRDAQWNRGRYLVEGPGHCGECHTPRRLFGQTDSARKLAGAPLLEGPGRAPNLTGAGIGDWSQADIAEALSSGFTPTGDVLGGAMAAVVRDTAQLPTADREAIAVYLKSLPAIASPARR